MFPGDYLRDTSHLTPLQHGCFMLLLLNYYSRGKALPSDKEALYRIASAMNPDERAAVDFVADSFFEKRNGALFNKKADELLAHDLERVESAKRSANARWKQCERNTNALETNMRTQCSPAPAPAPAPEPTPEKEAVANAPAALNSKKREFTDLWCSEYQKAFGVPYKFQGAKDGKAADSLLTLKLPAEHLVSIARQAWKKPEGFNCKMSVGLAGFSARFNEIRAEIGSFTSKPKTINEWLTPLPNQKL